MQGAFGFQNHNEMLYHVEISDFELGHANPKNPSNPTA